MIIPINLIEVGHSHLQFAMAYSDGTVVPTHWAYAVYMKDRDEVWRPINTVALWMN